MFIAYSSYNFVCFIIGKKIYKKFINPISLYAMIWELALLFEQSGLIYYYSLSAFTWFTIFFFQTLYIIGCCVGFLVVNRYCTEGFPINLSKQIKATCARKTLKMAIAITGGIAFISIGYGILQVIMHYGFNLVKAFNKIYADRVNDGLELKSIPYLGCFSLVALSLCGIYVKKYGFSFLILPVCMLPVLNTFTTGGRADIVFGFLLLFFAYLLTVNDVTYLDSLKKNGFSYKKLLGLLSLLIILGFLLIMFILTSKIRTSGAELTYATQRFIRIFGKNSFVYKLLSYVANPIATLNEYLKTKEFHFGENTFLWVFNAMHRLGLGERINQYQEWFYTPMGCNVATWIREVIEDFTYIGALPFAVCFGYMISACYVDATKNQKMKAILTASVFMMVVAISFFDWKIRSFGTWFAIFCGLIIGELVDKIINAKVA